MDSVVVTVNGKPAGTQSFSAAQAQQLIAVSEGSADQALQSTLVFSINTAAYNLTTGAVTYPNGPAAIAVVGYGHQGGSVATNTSSQGVNLLFANADAWIVAQTIGTTNVKNNANGFAYTTGSIAVSAIPVLYSGLAIGTATVQFGSGGCDNSAIGPRVLPLVAPATGAFAWTATFADASQTTNNEQRDEPWLGEQLRVQLCLRVEPGRRRRCIRRSIAVHEHELGSVWSGLVRARFGAPVVRLDNRAPVGLALALNCWRNSNGSNSWFIDDAPLNVTQATSASERHRGRSDRQRRRRHRPHGHRWRQRHHEHRIARRVGDEHGVLPLSEGAADALGNTAVAVTETFGADRTAPVLAVVGGPTNNTAFAS